MKKPSSIFFLLLFISSCTQQQNQKSENPFALTIVEAKGHMVPKDSMEEPLVIFVDENKLKKILVGKPKVVPTNTNVHLAGQPKIVSAGISRICIPGKDTFKLPLTVPAIDNPFIAGIPEVDIAKDATSKDQNPQNFSTFGKLQGLKQNNISCLLEDQNGNLWFGTFGGGASKYDGRSFTHYTDKEGLCNNFVKCMLQDKNGNIWFGTEGGVSKYDGKSFTNFTDKEGLLNNFIYCMLEDKNGNIWFGTKGGGVTKYDKKSFTHFTNKEGLSNNLIYSMLEDKNGNLWFGTYGGGAIKFDGKSFTHFTNKEGLCNNYVYSLLQDKNGNIWFGTEGGGVTKYDGKVFAIFTEKEGLSNNYVYCMMQDKNGNIWFGTEGGGVSMFDNRSFTHFTEKEGLSYNVVFSMLQDKNGNLWFGTYGGGVSKYDGILFTHFTEKEGLSNNAVFSILQDNNGNLWLSTYGGGVSMYDGKSFHQFIDIEGLGNNVVRCILQDKSGNLWFGTYGAGVIKYDGKYFTNFTVNEGLSNNFIRCMLQDKNGNIWFGTEGGGVSKYDNKTFTHFTEKTGLSSNFIYCMLRDKNDNIWFGTEGGGVTKYDNKTFTHFTDKEGLSNNIVYCMLQDGNGNLWFGTESAGVSKYDGKYFTQFTDKEGLCNNDVYSMLQDKNGNLWFGTRIGLSKIAKTKLKDISDLNNQDNLNKLCEGKILFKNYTYEDGFLGIGCNKASICEDKNGVIWIGANDRLTCYHPSQGEEMPDTNAPNIQITNIKLFNENIAWLNLEKNKDSILTLGNGVLISDFEFAGVTKWYGLPENLCLTYNNSYLTFNFVGITLKSPKKVKYKYKLEGVDKHWSAITNLTEAPYGNLQQGNYTFKVKAMNSDGYWSNDYSYSFTVRPPWWKTFWAYCLYFFTITGSIWYYVKWKERALKENKKILEKKVFDRTAEVVAEKKEVEKQKQRSEELLLNILPEEVAEELKLKGSAQAKHFDDVTIMFTDFKDFSRISEKLTPSELVAEIDTCFKAFDHIITKFHIEKIKTIGDSYMCAGGLPVINTSHAHDVIKAAMAIQQFMKVHIQDKIQEGKEPFEMRIGIHTGPVVAGIVGIKKFAYDIWGDSVNIASRMESSSEPGKINISGATYELVKDKFKCTHRGKIQAKNKGEVDMYFVESNC